MKLEVFRQSGQLVSDEAQQAFNSDWGPLFDKIQERIAAINADKNHRLYLLPAHVLSERFCNYMERQLFKKYSVTQFEELPKSRKAWTALMDKYKAPVMVAGRSDTGALVLVVMDTLGAG